MRTLGSSSSMSSSSLEHGVLLLSGYGIRVQVERGHLMVEDGIGRDRRWARFSRLDQDLKRLVIVGHTGYVTLEAIRWLHGVGVPLIHLDADGLVYYVAAPPAAQHAAVRRAQALAAETGHGLRLSIDLVAAKLAGQRAVLERLPDTERLSGEMRRFTQELQQVRTAAELRRTEGLAAQAYWSAWRRLPVRIRRRDLPRCPAHWLRFDSRTSPLSRSRSPMRAANPVNSALNYLYSVLEAEARIAALAAGFDPVLGLLHADHTGRDALALDLMEPVRPAVDAFVLDFIAQHEFTRDEVFETPAGQCRLLPPLAKVLAATAPRWARLVLPIAQRLAQQLVAAAQVQRPSPNESRRSHERRPQYRVMREFSPRLLPAEDPRYQPGTVAKRQRSVVRVTHENHRWEREGGSTVTKEEYKLAVVPGLRKVTLRTLMTVTGLSNASCSKIRRGMSIPHPRHWEPLCRLAQSHSFLSHAR